MAALLHTMVYKNLCVHKDTEVKSNSMNLAFLGRRWSAYALRHLLSSAANCLIIITPIPGDVNSFYLILSNLLQPHRIDLDARAHRGGECHAL